MFDLCSGWLQSATKDKDRGNSERAKTLAVGNFIFSILFFYFRPPMKVDAFKSLLSRYQSIPSHDIWLMATGSLPSLAPAL